jgi:flavin reductase (DIM6/NTAB) family NADH-FMN oxidoreductase RutF
MQHFSADEFGAWERFYRANVISGLSGFKPAFLVGSQNESGQPNLALFQNIVHLGAQPALIGLVNRPREATPHTLGNLEATGWFSLNAVGASFVQQAHQTSAKYEEGVSEFEATGLTLLRRPGIPLPFVAESPVQVVLRVEQVIPLPINGTHFIIGSVQAFYLADGLLGPDGYLSAEKANLVCTAGLDGYYLPRRIGRFSYAKPGKEVTPIQ